MLPWHMDIMYPVDGLLSLAGGHASLMHAVDVFSDAIDEYDFIEDNEYGPRPDCQDTRSAYGQISMWTTPERPVTSNTHQLPRENNLLARDSRDHLSVADDHGHTANQEMDSYQSWILDSHENEQHERGTLPTGSTPMRRLLDIDLEQQQVALPNRLFEDDDDDDRWPLNEACHGAVRSWM